MCYARYLLLAFFHEGSVPSSCLSVTGWGDSTHLPRFFKSEGEIHTCIQDRRKLKTRGNSLNNSLHIELHGQRAHECPSLI